MRALIFDFDGTIIDTDEAIYNSWKMVYERYAMSIPMEKWLTRVGQTEDNFDALKYLCANAPSQLDEQTVLEIQQTMQNEALARLLPRDGIQDWLQKAKDIGLQLAIASNSSKRWIVSHLSRINLLDYFDVIVCRDNVERLKPMPDLYQLALKKLNLNPEHAIAIEDSPSGATAAIAAGLNCLIIPNQLTMQLEFPLGQTRAESLAHLSLEDFLK